jgi:CheY-like chemotaxis protein
MPRFINLHEVNLQSLIQSIFYILCLTWQWTHQKINLAAQNDPPPYTPTRFGLQKHQQQTIYPPIERQVHSFYKFQSEPQSKSPRGTEGASMCQNTHPNSIRLPISKQTLSRHLLEPLTDIMDIFWKLKSGARKADSMTLEQMKQFMAHFERSCSDLELSGADMLKLFQCIAEQAKATTSTDSQPKPSTWLSILIVDDDERVREFHCRILKSLNCSVNIASNGYEALGMLCKSYDAILMDIQMPGMDGIETAMKIRQQGFDPQTTPIIAITANPLEEVRRKCQASIFSECIQKPMDINKLQKTLETLTTR